MPKVLIADKLSPRAKEIFEQNGIDADVKVGLPAEELVKIIGDYDALAIRSATKVTKEVLAVAKKLKVVGRAGIGVDNVDVPAATANGVIVMNTPFGNSITTAEHAIAMMFAAARKIPEASSSTHAGKWEKSKFMGTELAFKTLGLIGCGNIGSIVADRAQGLKMRVVVFDPFLTAERAVDLNVEKVSLDELLKRADFITLHVPLTEQTKNVLNKENLAKTKKGVFIVNCARGGLLDEAALAEAVKSGHVAGAALDVFEEEPATTNPLFGLENVVCTPHLGASTNEAQENVALQVAEQISEYLTKGTVINAVNVPSVSAEDASKLKPYIDLGEKLGKFTGQIIETGIKEVKIEFEGDAADLNTKPVTSVLLKGLLENIAEGVNMINSRIIATDRKIKVEEVKHERECAYSSLVTLTVTTERNVRVVKGTVFNGEARIVQVGDVKLEAALSPITLYVHNEDKPGLIGGVGQILGDNGINIASFHLGRSIEKKGEAIAIVAVDNEISDKVLAEIAKLPSAKTAKVLKF